MYSQKVFLIEKEERSQRKLSRRAVNVEIFNIIFIPKSIANGWWAFDFFFLVDIFSENDNLFGSTQDFFYAEYLNGNFSEENLGNSENKILLLARIFLQ